MNVRENFWIRCYRMMLILLCSNIILLFLLHRRVLYENPKEENGFGNERGPAIRNVKYIDGALDYESSHNMKKSYAEKQENAKSSSMNMEHPSFKTNLLCGGCRSTRAERGKACGELIARTMRKHNITLIDAARIVGKETDACVRCLPEACDEHSKQYWRYDHVAPPISYAQSHYLSSVPSDHRLPRSAFSNLTAFFSIKENVYPRKRYFFEYNPSIVRIPQSQILNIPGGLPVYLASYRVSTTQACFPDLDILMMIGGSWEKKPKQRNYLGLALLHSNLTIISETVVIPDLHSYEDFRLFVLNDQIYLSSFCEISPLWISTKRPMHGNRIMPSAFKLNTRNLYVTIREGKSKCSRDYKEQAKFKNLNYFVDGQNKTIVELWPLGPHRARGVKLEDVGIPQEEINETIDDFRSLPSFFTLEELHYAKLDLFISPFTENHGSTCCIPITDPRPGHNNNTLFLGLSHVKTPFKREGLRGLVPKNHFLSRVYAFETTTPYRVVAQSGLFCFGFPGEDEQRSVPTIKSSFHSILNLGESYNCPRIHFVSGMVEKAEDNSKVIFAYGVNDCTSRFIEVEKSKVVQLLFSPPPQTNMKQ